MIRHLQSALLTRSHTSRSLFAAALITLAALPLASQTRLLPEPHTLHAAQGTLALCQAPLTIRANAADQRAQQAIAAEFVRLCTRQPSSASSTQPALITLDDNNTQSDLPGTSDITGPAGREAYTLAITPTSIRIQASSPAGIGYGTQTLLQLLRPLSPSHASLAALTIEDWPSVAYRGLMIDTAHGARPTIEFMHQLLDTMEAWKLNQLYLYAETNLPLANPTPPWHENAWSRQEIADLVAYARTRHIDVVPCVEFYGHLHDLLTEESEAPIAAMPHGGELNPANPQTATTVSSWMHQIASLFPSPWIHIGFDEPFELDRLDTATRHNISPDKLWSEHLRTTATLALSLGKKPLFWADIDEGGFLFNKYPQLASSLPQGAVAVPWFYDARTDYAPLLSLFKQYHVPLMVAPAISDWDDIFPDYNTSFVNIQGMMAAGRAIGATGMINTIWSDSAMPLHRADWPGIAYGAAVAWQASPVSTQTFFTNYALLAEPATQAQQIASIYTELRAAESLLKASLGEEPAFRSLDFPFSSAYLEHARTHHKELVQSRLYTETALNTLHALTEESSTSSHLLTLVADARWIDYAALRALYAVEIDDNFRALPATPTADDLHYRLGWETASRNHSRVSDLIDRAGECLDAYRAAWLTDSKPYRLSTAEARFTQEQQFWIGFQEKIWRIRREFQSGSPRPTLEDLFAHSQ